MNLFDDDSGVLGTNDDLRSGSEPVDAVLARMRAELRSEPVPTASVALERLLAGGLPAPTPARPGLRRRFGALGLAMKAAVVAGVVGIGVVTAGGAVALPGGPSIGGTVDSIVPGDDHEAPPPEAPPVLPSPIDPSRSPAAVSPVPSAPPAQLPPGLENRNPNAPQIPPGLADRNPNAPQIPPGLADRPPQAPAIPPGQAKKDDRPADK